MKKPTILLSTNTINASALQPIIGDTHIVYSDVATAAAITKAGGLPHYIPSIKNLTHDDIHSYLDSADGIVLTGEDAGVNPLYYGESPLALTERIDDDRDYIDTYLIQAAYKRGLPLLGICKGAEIINVALGGTLYQNIQEQLPSSINHNVKKSDRSNITHKLHVEKGTIMYDIFREDTILVNGGHQQGIRELAEALKPTSFAEDGIIESFEQKEKTFILGVQFHPELRLFDDSYMKMFKIFTKHSENRLK